MFEVAQTQSKRIEEIKGAPAELKKVDTDTEAGFWLSNPLVQTMDVQVVDGNET